MQRGSPGPEPSPAKPVAVTLLCGALLGAYGWELALSLREGAAELESFLHAWGLVPREVLDGRVATVLTAMFLHAGPLHLASNVAFLAVFGSALEPPLGAGRFALLFAACGLASAVVHVAAAPASFVPTVGASGAVSGVLGGWWRLRDAAGAPFIAIGRAPALALLGLWLGAQLASALWTGGGGAAWAHLGGFATGLVVAPWLAPVRARTP